VQKFNIRTRIPVVYALTAEGRKNVLEKRHLEQAVNKWLNMNFRKKKMAMIKNISKVIGKLGLLSIVFLSLLAASAQAGTSETRSAAQLRAAKIKEAEQLLSNLGYWITSVDGKPDDSTRQGIIAFQKVNGMKRTGVLNDTLLQTMREATRPVAKHGGPAHVEIDISRQVIFLVDDAGEVTKVLATSTGNGERYFSEGKWQKAYTPRGTFKIQRQIKGVRKAPLGSLYNPSYFNGGIAIHGSNSIPVKAASHGCARIPRFADKQFVEMVKVGMPVYVYD
jgi:peptidoglycan hydrolase-like protein with peptidoglycan-binding domain